MPKVAIIGTGGTISSVGFGPLDLLDYAHSGQKMTIEQVVDKFPIVREAAELVLAVLDDDRVLTFPELASGRTRTDRVALFLSILELFKLGAVDLEQRPGDAIEISVRGSVSGAIELLGMLDASLEAALAEDQEPVSAGIGAPR